MSNCLTCMGIHILKAVWVLMGTNSTDLKTIGTEDLQASVQYAPYIGWPAVKGFMVLLVPLG